MKEMPLHDIKTAPAPNFDADVANTMVPNNAPAFPHAEETPFNVARQGLDAKKRDYSHVARNTVSRKREIRIYIYMYIDTYISLTWKM